MMRGMEDDWCVYAVRDGSEILYIGASSNLPKRTKLHRYTSATWWKDGLTVKAMSWHRHDSAAFAAERLAIIEHQPVHNIQWNPRYAKKVAQ